MSPSSFSAEQTNQRNLAAFVLVVILALFAWQYFSFDFSWTPVPRAFAQQQGQLQFNEKTLGTIPKSWGRFVVYSDGSWTFEAADGTIRTVGNRGLQQASVDPVHVGVIRRK